jgi:hypothetical protein
VPIHVVSYPTTDTLSAPMQKPNQTGGLRITLWRVCITVVAVEKQEVLHVLYVSVALAIQHAKWKCRIMLSSAACFAVPYFPHYLINGMIFFLERVVECKMCVDFLYNFCLEHFSFKEEFSDILSNVRWCSHKVAVIFVRL